MLKSFLNRFGKPEPESVEQAAIEALADIKGAPGTRVHHEYFVLQFPHNLKWQWLARVYGRNGEVNEKEGVADTEEQAKAAAIDWCNGVKINLGGA